MSSECDDFVLHQATAAQMRGIVDADRAAGGGLRYLSVCSGIEAATVAWHPLGWKPCAFAEIERFPSAVLEHHYPETPNLGDFTAIRSADVGAIDLLVGGTPCQSFSVAGLRAGLDDDRGNLALEFCLLARRTRPRWVVWENVPGLLSLDGGRAFASILGGLAECGYGLAYRVLDAQYVRVDGYARAVPQRRRRVFVVGHLGDWRRAAAVLFEPECLRRDPPPRREAGKNAAPTIRGRTHGGGGLGPDVECDGGLTAFGGSNTSGPIDVATTQTAHGGGGRFDFESETFVAHAIRGEGFDEVRRLTPTECERLQGFPDDYTLVPGAAKGGWRDLDPTESLEELQASGFRTRLKGNVWRVLDPDGPRYKALGNSMAVNVMRWIGQRIAIADSIDSIERAAT